MIPSSSADDPVVLRMFSAVSAGDTEEVRQLLLQYPALAHDRNAHGQTALHVAAECNDPLLGVILLANGADSQALLGHSGHTPLSWAVTCRALEFAGMLVRAGVVPDLFCAAGMGDLPALQTLLSQPPDRLPSRTGSSRRGPAGEPLPTPPTTLREQISDALYIACRNEQLEAVQLLLTYEPDLEFRAYWGGTPLHWAHFGGSREIIHLLESAGADQRALDLTLGCTPRTFGICVAANWGFTFLVEKQLRLDRRLANAMDGHTGALHEAAKAGFVRIVEILLAARADPGLRDGGGRTASEWARENGHSAVVELLRRHGDFPTGE